MHRFLEIATTLISCAALLLTGTAAYAAGVTTRANVDSHGTQGNGGAGSPALSADGRFVAFASSASNLVDNDTNEKIDIFVHDRQSGVTTRVSVNSLGGQSNDYSFATTLSADGRYVVFSSVATNLVANDTNEASDIFVHDRETGITSRISVNSDGTQGNSHSFDASASGNGRYIAFVSNASNLVANDTNGVSDVFVHDRETGITTRVSVADSSIIDYDYLNYKPTLSVDGRYVAFSTSAANLVASDTNATNDVFVHDLEAGNTERVSVSSDGSQGNGFSSQPSLSADGRYVAFRSVATNLVSDATSGLPEVFVHDRQSGVTVLASAGLGATRDAPFADSPALSSDGRYVAFRANASGLLTGSTSVHGIFVRDLHTADIILVSASSDGHEANGWSCTPNGYGNCPTISADGDTVAYTSGATNLVNNDTNGGGDVDDVFVHEWTTTLSIAKSGTGNGSITSTPTGISCGNRCAASFEKNTPITLTAIAEAGYTFTGWSGPADCADGVVTITDDLLTCVAAFVPTVTVETTDLVATENKVTTAEYTFTRTGNVSAPLTVHFGMSGSATEGSDYVDPGTSVTFPPSARTVTKVITPISDGSPEPEETATLQIVPDSGYVIGTPSTATTIINDVFPEVSVVANIDNISESGLIYGEVTFTRTGSTATPLTVIYESYGRAWINHDYHYLGNSITFPVGVATLTKTVVPIDDQEAEPNETVTIRLRPSMHYTTGVDDTATINITSDDLPVITLTAEYPVINESTPYRGDGRLVFARTNGCNTELTIDIQISGTATMGSDYKMLSSSITFPEGECSVEQIVIPIYDALKEPTETVIVALASDTNYIVSGTTTATVNIRDATPIVRVSAIDSTATEVGRDIGKFRLTRTGSINQRLKVSFRMGGTATAGRDYISLGQSVVFPAGVRVMVATVRAINDNLREPKERVVFRLTPNSSYIVSSSASATVTIISDE